MLRKLLVLSAITVSLYTAGLNVSNDIKANILRASNNEATTTYYSFQKGLGAQVPLPASGLDDSEFTMSLDPIVQEDIPGSVRVPWMREGINYFIGRVIGLLASVIGAVAILMISYGGFLMITFSANEEMYRKGVDYIKYAVIGLVMGLSAYIMVTGVQLLIHSIYS